MDEGVSLCLFRCAEEVQWYSFVVVCQFVEEVLGEDGDVVFLE
jgi:hypothetical protein